MTESVEKMRSKERFINTHHAGLREEYKQVNDTNLVHRHPAARVEASLRVSLSRQHYQICRRSFGPTLLILDETIPDKFQVKPTPTPQVGLHIMRESR